MKTMYPISFSAVLLAAVMLICSAWVSSDLIRTGAVASCVRCAA